MAVAESGMNGVLPVDKPAGPTSHDIVATARRTLGVRRVGHTGTLDPFASGLLLLCFGQATRIAEYLTGLDKRYRATVRLGTATDTDDLTGAVTASADPAGIGSHDVEAALAGLRGSVLQVPPQYSAKKVAGERAYAAARQGREVRLRPVAVTIHELHLTAFRSPDADIEVLCSSGTYIRAIARDLGDALGVGAHLTALRRTAIGSYHVDSAVTPGDFDRPGAAAAAIVPTAAALRHLPRFSLEEGQAGELRHGRTIHVGAVPDAPVVVAAVGSEAVAIGECAAGVFRPRKVFQ
jgi:tRNA pseudouridine55 synthase